MFLARPARVPRGLAVALAAGVVAGAVAGGVVSGVFSSSDSGESFGTTSSAPPAAVLERRAALAAFEDALRPLREEGGFVVAMGMRPGVADISEGAFDDETLATMADGWRISMESIRSRFRELEVPDFLSAFAVKFDRSLVAYVAVAEALGDAARARGDDRDALIDEVADLGERADGLYDEALAEIDRWRAELGADAGPKEST